MLNRPAYPMAKREPKSRSVGGEPILPTALSPSAGGLVWQCAGAVHHCLILQDQTRFWLHTTLGSRLDLLFSASSRLLIALSEVSDATVVELCRVRIKEGAYWL